MKIKIIINLFLILFIYWNQSLPLDDLKPAAYYNFTQQIDHFGIEINLSNQAKTFQQRYCINKKFVEKNKQPPAVFLIIGGESPLVSEVVNRMPFIQVANETKSLIIALEVRFYGQSQPFKMSSANELNYLTTEQIIEDIANFQESITRMYKIPDSKWIIMGCSYAGTLSAWYRLQYPHLAYAAISSSSPLRAELKFEEFDLKVRGCLGPQCSKALKVLFTHIQTSLNVNASAVKSGFQCPQTLDDKMFLFMLSEALTYSVQYNAKFHLIENICPKLIENIQKPPQMLEIFKGYVKDMFFYHKNSCMDYDLYEFSNSNHIDQSGTRSWAWQLCKEYGWFTTPADNDSFKSQTINECWWTQEVCKKMFGKAMAPRVDHINTLYDIKHFKLMNNILFTGCQADPWDSLSIGSNPANAPYSTIISIPNESHCANWYAETPSDSKELRDARVYTNSIIRQFVNPTCKQTECDKKKGLCTIKRLNSTSWVATSVCVPLPQGVTSPCCGTQSKLLDISPPVPKEQVPCPNCFSSSSSLPLICNLILYCIVVAVIVLVAI
ncbi:hypothetical protein DLAC_10364 [Tieghemostelium lacteum]|uniref:Peptidase S28 family protein n=1 Tax=Tieghemostelium lacteum TaxID=361077 RepID=A0A151Z5P5_TIELA|nr:hypothetical protein DLAC_10364 [Tieghemostelium lacteum]|eukprot:KYQ89124.1 hypothetical protein DLAC_10364 [Tieghemostelium lacteum]